MSTGVCARAVLSGLVAMLVAAAAPVAFAQDAATFPNKTVRLLVGFPPGGPADVLARVVGERLQALWKQPVVIDNRAGANGTIAAAATAKAQPDGYTLFLVTSTLVQTPKLMTSLPYDPLRDFTAITNLAYIPQILVVHPSVPANTFEEFVAYAKAHPDAITTGSSGVGSAPHLAAAMLAVQSGASFTHVHYRGSAPAQTALLTGEVKAVFANPVVAMPMVQAGTVRPLATTGTTRWRDLLQLPTVAERGYPGFEAGSWLGIIGPAGIPPAVLDKLNADIGAVVRIPEVATRLTGLGLDIRVQGPKEFQAEIVNDLQRWSNVIRDAKIQPES